MNKFTLLAQLLLLYSIKGLTFTTPEECLKELNCNDELNCVASCYNVPAPDRNSVIKTADCQNGCLAKYPNNLPTDWANLNQCYIDCVQNNYFNTPAEYIAAVKKNNNNINNENSQVNNNTSNDNISNNANSNANNNSNNANINTNTNTNTNNNLNNNNNDINSNISDNINVNDAPTDYSNNNGSANTSDEYSNILNQQNNNINNSNGPINATDNVTSYVVDNSFIPGFTYNQIFVNIGVMFLVYFFTFY